MAIPPGLGIFCHRLLATINYHIRAQKIILHLPVFLLFHSPIQLTGNVLIVVVASLRLTNAKIIIINAEFLALNLHNPLTFVRRNYFSAAAVGSAS